MSFKHADTFMQWGSLWANYKAATVGKFSVTIETLNIVYLVCYFCLRNLLILLLFPVRCQVFVASSD